MALRDNKNRGKGRSRGSADRSAAAKDRPVDAVPVHETRAFHAAAVLLTLVALYTVWGNRFLPLQDYPNHLFNAHVASTYNDPSQNWSEYYELANPFAPYRLTSFALRLVATLTGAEIAGKVAFTIYLVLLLLLVYRVRRWVGPERSPWNALLFMPLCFHQMYFYGFLNFVLSIPVLLLALMDLEDLVSEPLTRRSALRQGAWSVAVFFVHPFAAAIYIVLSGARALTLFRDRAVLVRALLPAALLTVLYLTWLGISWLDADVGSSIAMRTPQLRWWPFEWLQNFLLLVFAGMTTTTGLLVFPLAIWEAILALILLSAVLHRREVKVPWPYLLLLVLAIAGYFLLPFSVRTSARYTFFNTRFAPVSYFLLVLVLAWIPMRRYTGHLVALGCLAVLGYSAQLQARVSEEVATIVPITEKMRKNAAVLPMIRSSRSAHLDPFFYAQHHHKDVFYYHLLVGGGVNPDLFRNELMTVRYKKGKRPPRPAGRQFQTWPQFREHYDYIITRGLPARLDQQLQGSTTLIARSGDWRLYELPRR